MLDRSSGERVWRSLLGRWAVYEVSSGTALVLIWSLFLGLADWRVYLGLYLLRIAANFVVLRSSCEAYVRDSDRLASISDHDLVELDRGMQSAPQRFLVVNTIGWVLCCVVSTAAGMLAPTPLPIGNAELLTGAMMLAAVVGGQWVSIGMFDPALSEARQTIAAQLVARGLAARRRSTSIVRQITGFNIMFVLAVFYGMLALGGMAAVDGWRSTALAQQQLRVELGAVELARSGELPQGLTIVTREALPPALAESLSSTDATLLEIDEREGLALAAAPLADGRWLLGQASTDERLWQIGGAALVLPCFFVFLFIAANRSLVGTIASQLEQLRRATQQVLTGGQLSGIPRSVPAADDEVGRLVIDFNGMLDVFDELVEAARAVADGDLAVEFERSGELHDAFRGMLAQLREVVAQIRSTAVELASTAAEIHAVSREQERVAATQSNNMAEIGTTIELLAQAAEHVSRTSEQVVANAEQTLSNTDDTVARIDELNAQVGNISLLLEVIHEIADRSDLLALNGSLEAVRAGEAGRGFALVASEMRRLAERVAGSVADARGRMASISSAGASTVMASGQSRDLAEKTSAAAHQIWEVIEVQHHDTQRVAVSVSEVVESVAASAAASSQTRAAAEGLRAQADELERLTRRFRVAAEPTP